MIVKNSLKSVLRSPVKTILFFLLLLSLTTALTLGSALVGMCSVLIEECDRTYITEVSVEYRGGRFPYKAVADENARTIREKIDFDQLSKLPFVKAVDRSEAAVVSVENFPSVLTESYAENVFIGVIRKMSSADKAVKVLYATSIIDNSVIRVAFNEEVEGGYFLVSGFTDGSVAGVIDVTVGEVINNEGVSAGAVQEFCWIDVSDDPNLEKDDPRYEFFFSAAETYKRINSSTYVQISEDPSFLEPFVEKEFTFKEGALYTKKDIEENGVCCILPAFIAERMDYKPGDRVDLRILSDRFGSIIDSYWNIPGKEDGSRDVQAYLTGVFSTTSQEKPIIYMSGLGDGEDRITGFCGYTLGTLKIANGTKQEDIERLAEMLPEGAEISVKDQGYSVIVEMLKKLRVDAAGVTAAAMIATAVMIILFGYVFVGRQADTLVTMFMMGTPGKDLVKYVATASLAVLIPAGILGCGAAYVFSDILTDFISKTLAEGGSVLKLYSTASLGTVSIIEVNVGMPVWPGIACAAGLIAAGIVSCLAFLSSAVGNIGKKTEEKPKKKEKKPRVPVSAKPIGIKGAGLKYIVLSFVRGGLRSVAVPLIGVVMTLFILVPAGAITVYENRLSDLEKNTVIKGYLTDYGGKKSYDLVFTESMVERLKEGDYFTDFHFSLCDPYRVYSYVKKENPGDADGEYTQLVEEPPSGGFSAESFLANFMTGPKIFYTDDVSATPEFFTGDHLKIDYLEGYDDSYFSYTGKPFEGIWAVGSSGGVRMYDFEKDLRELCAVVPDTMLEKYGLKLGDILTIDVSEDLARESYLIIGSFKSSGGDDTIYTRIQNSPKLVKAGTDKLGNVILRAKLRGSYSCCTFKLADTSKIREAKLWLYEKGFSRVHSAGFYRLYPVLSDRDYCDSIEKIEKNIGYLKNVVPALAVLVGLAGFAAAALMAYRRRVEIATLRSIGEKDIGVFFIFLTEQFVPAVAGSALCLGVFAMLSGINVYSAFAVSFIAGFAAGSVVSLLKMSKTNLLDVLSDKE